jgi:serine/threonine-protein kinase/endoribonuclease IRE1
MRSTTAILLVLIVLPWISTAAQQQQSPQYAQRRSPREESHVDTITPLKAGQPNEGRNPNPLKRNSYTPLISQNARAVATKVFSAPADDAVRAPLARNAPPSGGITPKSARSLRDWEVEVYIEILSSASPTQI